MHYFICMNRFTSVSYQTAANTCVYHSEFPIHLWFWKRGHQMQHSFLDKTNMTKKPCSAASNYSKQYIIFGISSALELSKEWARLSVWLSVWHWKSKYPHSRNRAKLLSIHLCSNGEKSALTALWQLFKCFLWPVSVHLETVWWHLIWSEKFRNKNLEG